MPNLILAYKNILDTATVSLTAGTADASFPLYRLYDRMIGFMFKITAAETLEVHIDQGASGNIAADRLLIPSGHNLDGMTCDILYSDNNSDWSAAVTQWVQSGSGVIDKSWTAITHRYWKFKITTPASIPQFSELFLSSGTYTWESNPNLPTGRLDNLHNVERTETSGGYSRRIKHGELRRQRLYGEVRGISATQQTNILAFNAECEELLSFFLCDHDGVWLWGELTSPLNLRLDNRGNPVFDFNFLEVLQ